MLNLAMCSVERAGAVNEAQLVLNLALPFKCDLGQIIQLQLDCEPHSSSDLA